MTFIPLIAVLSASITVGGPPLPLRSADEVVTRMIVRDAGRQAALHGYTAARRYVLENGTRHKRAEMLVRMTCREDGSKTFEVVSESGWRGARKFVFPRLLDAEIDAARPGFREQSRITPDNYTFEMVGTESLRGRPAYVISIKPRTANKYLTCGTIWVDAEDYAIVRVEGRPAKNPSFWIKSVHFVHDYGKTASFWFPVSDHSVTDARIFGSTELTIEYFDYMTNDSVALTNHGVRQNQLRGGYIRRTPSPACFTAGTSLITCLTPRRATATLKTDENSTYRFSSLVPNVYHRAEY